LMGHCVCAFSCDIGRDKNHPILSPQPPTIYGIRWKSQKRHYLKQSTTLAGWEFLRAAFSDGTAACHPVGLAPRCAKNGHHHRDNKSDDHRNYHQDDRWPFTQAESTHWLHSLTSLAMYRHGSRAARTFRHQRSRGRLVWQSGLRHRREGCPYRRPRRGRRL
jgi:hypothetical protein